VTVLIARVLHLDGFGRYAAVWSFGLFVATLVDLGLPYFIAVEAARVPRAARRLTWTAFALRLYSTLPAVLLSLAALPLLRFRGNEAIAAMLFVASALCDGFATQALSYFRATARMHVEAAITSGGRVALVAGTALALFLHPSLIALGIAAAAASAGTAAYAIVRFARAVPLLVPRRRETLAVGKATLTFAANGLLGQIFFRIDVLLLRAFGVADVAIGAYSSAYRVMEAPRAIFGSIAAGGLPEAATLSGPAYRVQLRQLGARLATLAIWTVAPATLLFAIAPATVVDVLFGKHFAAAAPLLRWLAPMPILMALDAVAITLVTAIGGQRRLTAIFAALAVLNVALNIVLIPHLGATAAAIATVATELTELGLVAATMYGRLGVVRPKIVTVGLACVTGVIVASFAPNDYAKAIAALCVYAVAAAIFVRRRQARLA
jgi:O-antigen/teichoic acid export membrane protein